MSELEELEKRIRGFPADQFAKFREWLFEFDNLIWDQQIEADSKAGKLDKVAAEALAEYKAGKARRI